MLRYDRCTPLTEAAATKMIPNLVNGNQTSIRMVCYTETQRQGPTAGRWESFGWQVKDIKYRKLTGSAKHTKPA
jgi:transketolase N-terminal domain/subunit